MEKILLIFCFILTLGMTANAQSFEFEVDDFRKCFDPTMTEEPINYGFVQNLHFTTNNLYWKRTEVYLPDGWGSVICDNVACYTEAIGERFYNLDVDELATFDVHAKTNGFPGDSAIIEMCVWEVADSANTVQCRTYTFYTDLSRCTSSTTSVDPDMEANVQIAPNPAADYFNVKSDITVGNIDVYNIIGAKVKSFDKRQQSPYDISELPTGMYLVRVFSEDNTRMLNTLRLKKR